MTTKEKRTVTFREAQSTPRVTRLIRSVFGFSMYGYGRDLNPVFGVTHLDVDTEYEVTIN